jgi:hypothetical protein
MLSQWLWSFVNYAEPMVVKHCEQCWSSGRNHVVNHDQSCCAIGWESCCIMLSQSVGITMWTLCKWVWIMVCFSEPLVGNHDMNAPPVGVNHGELCWASIWESRCAMLSQCLWINVNYAEILVLKHFELCWASACESLWYPESDV